MTTTRFLNGVNAEADNSVFKDIGLPNPLKYYTVFNDFTSYDSNDWKLTVTNASTAIAQTAGDGGVITLTTTAENPDKGVLQAGNSSNALNSITVTSGKKMFFEARFKASDVNASGAMVIGLVDSATSVTGVTPADGIYFSKAYDTTSVSIYVDKGGTATSATGVATLTANTYVKLAWFYDGASTVTYAVDDVVKGTLAVSSTYLPTDSLTATVAYLTKAAKVLTLDYVFAAIER